MTSIDCKYTNKPVRQRILPSITVLTAAAVLFACGKPEQLSEQQQQEVQQRIAPVGQLNLTNPDGVPVADAADAAAAEPSGVAKQPAAALAGDAVYKTSCQACHTGAIPGAPVVGDKADWSKRLAAGKDTLYASAINGKPGTLMTAKGGNTALSDDEVRAAVDYMLQASR